MNSSPVSRRPADVVLVEPSGAIEIAELLVAPRETAGRLHRLVLVAQLLEEAHALLEVPLGLGPGTFARVRKAEP